VTYPERLLHSFRELYGLVLSRESVASTLDVVARLAVETIPACDLASVSLVRGAEILTVGTSDDVAFLLDEIQYEMGEGPCLDAIAKDEMWFRIDDMTTDTMWPDFSARAARYGFASLLAFTLRIDHDTLGALNLYARAASGFAAEDVENGAIYAAHAAVALANSQAAPGRTEGRAELNEALLSQEIIARAVGILMEKEFRTPEEAFEILEERAEHLKIQLRDCAQEVLLTADRERADLELPEGFVRRVMGRSRDR
jgi:transcriptional regulator with GAF, ATPase, and Fis domain